MINLNFRFSRQDKIFSHGNLKVYRLIVKTFEAFFDKTHLSSINYKMSIIPLPLN